MHTQDKMQTDVHKDMRKHPQDIQTDSCNHYIHPILFNQNSDKQTRVFHTCRAS